MVVNTDKDELTPKLLDSINMTKPELDAFIMIVRSTNAVIIDRNRDGQFYFIAKGFLDDNNGILYSPFKLEEKDIFGGNNRIHFTDNYIFRWEHIKGNWYKAYGGN
ncbi:MAG: hypothetical protein N4A72_21075 [Bacteroidales bacterium]|jgi:hypothetical protein|nr:hypothetical protein [Bacteroidales bacterium]